jgi:hypothetical protein
LPEGTTIYPESQDPGAAQGVGGDPKKKAPVKDERSWIMKNWIFLIPAGMLVSCYTLNAWLSVRTSVQAATCDMAFVAATP